MLKIILVSAFVLLRVGCQTSYYVDCNTGDDSKSGTSPSTAWASIEKVNSDMSVYSTASGIYFHRGCVWTQSLVINGIVGQEGSEFIIDAYGDSNLLKPKIDVTQPVSSGSWALDSGSIYSVSVPNEVTQVFVDGERYNISHYPVGLENFFYIAAAQTTNTVVDVYDDFVTLSQAQVVGARFIVRSSRWTFHSATVVGYDPVAKTVTIDDGGGYAPYKLNYGFYLMNMKWMLSEGTWFYDNSDQRLYIWIKDSSHPNQHEVKFISNEQHPNGIEISSSEYLVLRNFQVFASMESGIRVAGRHHVTVSDCEVYYAGTVGIGVYGASSEYSTVDSCIVKDSGQTGIVAKYRVPWSTITNNLVENVFLAGPLQTIYTGNKILGHGIYTDCTGYRCVVSGNVVRNTGYIGIACYGISNHVSNNLVDSSCLTADDCGLIYWWKGGNHTIESNLLLNSVGNSFGTPSYPQLTYDGSAQGIYPDDLSANSTIRNNVIINAKWGFQLHNSRNNVVENNIVFNSRSNAFLITEDTIGNVYSWSRHNIVRNNVFHSLYAESFRVGGGLDWIDMFDELDNNVYFPDMFAVSSPSTGNVKLNGIEMFSRWSEEQGLDTWDSNSVVLGGEEYESVPFVGEPITDNLVENGNFSSSDTSNWGRWPSEFITQEYDSECGCMKITTQPAKEDNWLIATSSQFEIKLDQDYVLEFEFWVDDDSVSDKSSILDGCRVVVRQIDNPYASVGLSDSVALTAERSLFSIPFKGTMEWSDSRVDFYVGTTAGTHYYLDNVKIYEANLIFHDIVNDFEIRYNEEFDQSLVIDDADYCDVHGNVVKAGSINLQPLEGIVLVKCFCNLDNVCNNRENAKTCTEDSCVAVCGNGVCESPETFSTCPSDCLNVLALVISILVILFACCIFVTVVIVVIVVAVGIKIKTGNSYSGMNEGTPRKDLEMGDDDYYE